MFWETPQQRRAFLLFPLGTAVGLPLFALSYLWLTSLVNGQGGVIDHQDWGVVYLAAAISAIPAMLFLVGLMDWRSDHGK